VEVNVSLQETAKIIFQGEDNVSRVMVGIGGHLDDFGNKVSGLNQAAADFTAPFASIAAGALKTQAAIAAAGAAMVTLSITQAGQFSDSFNEISTLFEATDADLDVFKKNLLNYSRDSSFAFEDINAAVYQAISFGADYRDALAAINVAEKLAIGGKADLQATTELLSGTLNAYGAKVSEAGRYSDIFFTIVKDGKTTIPELAAGLSQVTGIAAAAGIPMDDLGAAIAAITATGAPTSQTLTSLKALISNIIKPTKDASETAELLGISFDATALKTRGLDGVLADVYTRTGGNVTQMGKLFGSTEALNAALILGADSSGKFAKALEDMQTATGATDAAYERMADNISLINQNVINNARAAMVEFGSPLLSGYRDVADGIVEIFKGLSISIDGGAFDPIFDELNAQAGEAAKMLRAMAEALPEAMKGVDLGGLLDSFREFGVSLAGLFTGVDLTSADGLKKAIQGVVDAAAGLTRFSSGIVEGAGPIIRTLIDWAKGFNDLEDDTKRSTGELFGFLAIINKLSEPIGLLIAAVGGLVSGFQLIVSLKTLSTLADLGKGATETAKAVAQTATVYDNLGLKIKTVAIGQEAMAASNVSMMARLGPLALALTAVAVGAYAIKSSYDSWQAAEAELKGSLERGAAARQNLADKYAKISEQTGIAISGTEHFHQLIRDGILVADREAGAWVKATNAKKDYTKELKAAAEAGMDWSRANRQLVDEFGNLYGTVDKATAAVDKNRQAAIEAATAYNIFKGNPPEVARAMAEMDKGIVTSTGKMKDAEKQTEAMALKLLGMASDERLRKMELGVRLNIAGVEASTKEFEAMFTSFNNTISNTSNNIGALFGLLNDASDFGTKWAIEDQLEKENDLRDETARLQKRRAEAETELAEAQARRVREGGSLINITADGLEPELEAFMFKIIERVQIRVNESAADFLLVSP